MGDLLTIRLDQNEKDALALSSKLSDMPISKVIMPYISEGIKMSLGAILMFQIDRSTSFNRRSYEEFTSMILEPTRTGPTITVKKSPEEVKYSSPKVIWDFFEILHDNNVIEKLDNVLEEVALKMDTTYVTPTYLRTICYRIGEDYIRSGGNMDRLDFQLASDIFFREMLEGFYMNNATGTVRALSSELYTHQGFFKDLSREMVDTYTEKTRTRKFQAIEVEANNKKRGRPKKKVKRRPLIAEEI